MYSVLKVEITKFLKKILSKDNIKDESTEEKLVSEQQENQLNDHVPSLDIRQTRENDAIRNQDNDMMRESVIKDYASDVDNNLTIIAKGFEEFTIDNNLAILIEKYCKLEEELIMAKRELVQFKEELNRINDELISYLHGFFIDHQFKMDIRKNYPHSLSSILEHFSSEDPNLPRIVDLYQSRESILRRVDSLYGDFEKDNIYYKIDKINKKIDMTYRELVKKSYFAGIDSEVTIQYLKNKEMFSFKLIAREHSFGYCDGVRSFDYDESMISIESPLGMNVLGKKRGDIISINGDQIQITNIISSINEEH